MGEPTYSTASSAQPSPVEPSRGTSISRELIYVDSKVFAGPCSHIYDHSIMWPLPGKQWAWQPKKQKLKETKRVGQRERVRVRGKQIVVYVHFHYHLIPFHLCGRIIYARCFSCCLPKLASICPTHTHTHTHTHSVHAPAQCWLCQLARSLVWGINVNNACGKCSANGLVNS